MLVGRERDDAGAEAAAREPTRDVRRVRRRRRGLPQRARHGGDVARAGGGDGRARTAQAAGRLHRRAASRVAVGFAIMSLDWHFPSDVAGGYLVATTWCFAALAVLRTGRLKAALPAREEPYAWWPAVVAMLVPLVVVGWLALERLPRRDGLRGGPHDVRGGRGGHGRARRRARRRRAHRPRPALKPGRAPRHGAPFPWGYFLLGLRLVAETHSPKGVLSLPSD